MLELFWELHQRSKIEEAGDSARFAARSARSAASKAHELEMQMDKLTLTCAALWSLLKKSGFTDADLEAAIRDADLSDGQLDGRIRTKPTDCPSCGRTISRRHDRCLYCGDQRDQDPFANI